MHQNALSHRGPRGPVGALLREKEPGYTGSANLLARNISQGRVEADHATLSAKSVTRLLLTNPDHLRQDRTDLRDKLAAACPEMTALAELVAAFANLLTPEPSSTAKLGAWINRVRACDVHFLNSFANGLQRDRAAVQAALTLLPQRPYRGRQWADQTAQTADLRPSGLPAAAPPHPAQLTQPRVARSTATKILEEPR